MFCRFLLLTLASFFIGNVIDFSACCEGNQKQEEKQRKEDKIDPKKSAEDLVQKDSADEEVVTAEEN